MSYPDSPGWPEPSDHGHDDPYPGRQRARHFDAAPDAYPGGGGFDDFQLEFDRAPRERSRPPTVDAADGTRPRPARRRGPVRRREQHRESPEGTEGWAGVPSAGEPVAPVDQPTAGWTAEPAAPVVDQWTAPGRPGWTVDPGADWADQAPTAQFAAVTDVGPDPVEPAAPAPEATAEQTEPAGRAGRAGRNLPAAIGVGVTLGAIVLASLFVWRPAFLVVVIAAVWVGVWEMVRAVHPSGAHPPLVPLVAGGTAMTALAWYGGAEALTLGLVATAVAALVWRLAEGPSGYQRDVAAAILIAVYVPFLGGFAVLLARPEDGALRVVAALAGVVLSDTGGYIAGVFLGKHPMAPSVSPKKSWEGFAGSLVATAAGGALLLYLMFDVAPWYGALFGLTVSAASVLGDLAESLLKRDLGIKDMSNLLPGHGGLMDRLDSVLFALPVAYAVLVLVAPVPT
jgi:phosphatidate cytidylyltransferase